MSVTLNISDPYALGVSVFGIVVSLIYMIKVFSSCVKPQDYDTNLKQSLDGWLKEGRPENENDRISLLIKDYEISSTELGRRDNILLVVGTILITSSFLIFGSATKVSGFALSVYAFASIGLFTIWLLVLFWTDTKLDKISYDRLKAIEESLRGYVHYDFGVYSHIFRKTISSGKNRPDLWLLLRRSFWSIILFYLSLAWLFTSFTF